MRPERALLHPVWLGALALLGLNDHVWKASGLLPCAITGKLSDFAGLVVAPALLATLARASRRGAILRCHVAVGVVFAALELWPRAGAAWDRLLGWRSTPDPTDLCALVSLAVSWFTLVPAMARPVRARRLAEWAAGAAGLILCTATSVEPPCEDKLAPPVGGWQEDDNGRCRVYEQASVYLHNSTGVDRPVTIHRLDDALRLDCDLLAEDAGGLLSADLFTSAFTRTVPAGWQMALSDASSGCHAALIESAGLPARIVLWSAADYPARLILAAPGEPADLPAGGIAIEEQDGSLHWSQIGAGPQLLYEPSAPASPAPGCALPPDTARLEWTSAPLDTDFVIADLYEAADGCLVTTLAPEGGGDLRWDVCGVAGVFPFVVGETVRMSATPPGLAGSRLRIDRAAPATPALAMRLYGGPGTGDDLEASIEPIAGCNVVPTTCDGAARAARGVVSIAGGPAVSLAAGETGSLDAPGGARLFVTVVRAERWAIVNTECSSDWVLLQMAAVERGP